MTRPSTRDCIDDPLFWHEFLRRLSHTDPEYDTEIIRSLCEATRVSPQKVLAKMKTYMHYANPSTAAH